MQKSIQDSSTLYEAAIKVLSRFNLNQTIRLVGIAAFDLTAEKEQPQMTLFEESAHNPQQEKREQLEKLGDAIQEKYGEHTVVS